MLKGYRSHIINGLAAFAAIIALPDVGGLVDPMYIKYVVAAQGIIAIIMRQLTTTPVGVSAES